MLILYDVNSKKSFEDAAKWIKCINEYGCKHITKILVATKCDKKPQWITRKEGEALAARHNIPFLETSAKVDFNVDRVFKLLAKMIMDKIRDEKLAAGDFKNVGRRRDQPKDKESEHKETEQEEAGHEEAENEEAEHEEAGHEEPEHEEAEHAKSEHSEPKNNVPEVCNKEVSDKK